MGPWDSQKIQWIPSICSLLWCQVLCLVASSHSSTDISWLSQHFNWIVNNLCSLFRFFCSWTLLETWSCSWGNGFGIISDLYSPNGRKRGSDWALTSIHDFVWQWERVSYSRAGDNFCSPAFFSPISGNPYNLASTNRFQSNDSNTSREEHNDFLGTPPGCSSWLIYSVYLLLY